MPGSASSPEAEDLLRAIFETSDVLSGVFELEGDDYRYLVVNPAAAAFYGRAPEALVGRTGRDMGLAPEQIQRRMEVLRACWADQRPRRLEYRFDHGGASGWFLGSFTPLPGERPRVGFVLLDITRQKLAEAAAADQRRKLEVALDAAELGLWEYDIRRDMVVWDTRMRQLFGVAEHVAVDFALYASRLHPDDRDRVQAAYQAALTGTDRGRYQVEHRIAESLRWVRSSGQVVFDSKGRAERVIGTSRDVSAEVAAREQEHLLMAELNHRVKNNLATVQSIARQTARAAGDIPGFVATFEGRLLALARTHDVLTARAWKAADLGEVVARETSVFADRVSRDGPKAPLSSRQALALGMIIHELSTNAVKYGALSTPAGAVQVSWRKAEGVAHLTWTERGGPRCKAPVTQGFGTRLMRRLAQGDLGGEIAFDYRAAGLVVRLSCLQAAGAASAGPLGSGLDEGSSASAPGAL